MTARVLVPVEPLRRALILRLAEEAVVGAFLERLARDVVERAWPEVKFATARQRAWEVFQGRYSSIDWVWADRFACALDRNPHSVWADAWEEAMRLVDDASDDLGLV